MAIHVPEQQRVQHYQRQRNGCAEHGHANDLPGKPGNLPHECHPYATRLP